MTRFTARLPLLLGLLAMLIIGLGFLLGTEHGRRFLENPHTWGQDVRQFVQVHSLLAPVVLACAYVLATVLMLPVIPLQVLAGYGFGWMAIVWCQIAATVAATVTFLLSRYLLGDWFHKRVEARVQKLRDLEEGMGRNGFLVVMVVRLMHFMPFGASNYAFGLTSISLRDVALGTLLGNIPAASFYVMVGIGIHPTREWRAILALVILNLVLLIPLFIRYIRPQWFRRYGIE